MDEEKKPEEGFWKEIFAYFSDRVKGRVAGTYTFFYLIFNYQAFYILLSGDSFCQTGANHAQCRLAFVQENYQFSWLAPLVATALAVAILPWIRAAASWYNSFAEKVKKGWVRGHDLEKNLQESIRGRDLLVRFLQDNLESGGGKLGCSIHVGPENLFKGYLVFSHYSLQSCHLNPKKLVDSNTTSLSFPGFVMDSIPFHDRNVHIIISEGPVAPDFIRGIEYDGDGEYALCGDGNIRKYKEGPKGYIRKVGVLQNSEFKIRIDDKDLRSGDPGKDST